MLVEDGWADLRACFKREMCLECRSRLLSGRMKYSEIRM